MAEIIRINEGSWRIEDGGVRFFLLCGSDRALLVDSGMNTPDARKIAESITELPVELLNTHADRDHVAGNAAFGRAIMSPAEEAHYREGGWTGEVVPVKEGDVIDLGGRKLLVIDIPGHTPGSIALLDEDERVLISGDSVQDGNIYMFGAARDLSRYPDSMRHLLEYSGLFDEVWPSHSSFPVSPELIPQLIDGAEKILSGEAKGEPCEVHGRTIKLVRFPFAGFYCEPDE